MTAARGWLAGALLGLPLVAAAALPPEPELPDLRRGQKAAAAGDVARAERDLLPLAQLGYLEAQVALARLYAQSESRETVAQAVKWYRVASARDPQVAVPLARALLRLEDPATVGEAQRFLENADRKGDPRALAALLEFYTDRPERAAGPGVVAALVKRAGKARGPEVEGALIRWYRRNAHVPDHADQLAIRCADARDRQPECYVDLARYQRARGGQRRLDELVAAARKRYAAGRLGAPIVERMAWSLASDSHPGEPRPDLAYPLLKQVMKSSVTAQVRVARLQVEYPQLDPRADPERLLQAALAQGSAEAALALGRLYLNGTRVVADPARAEDYLTRAAASEPAAHYFLGRLYKRGELGQAEPVRAAEHLLAAARGGYARADYLLAQLFSDGRGARVNRTNAFVFASLAARNGVPEAPALLAQLRAGMSAGERQHAERLLEDEAAARGPATATATLQQTPATAPGGAR